MSNISRCPCDNCITVAICRHKSFSDVIECPLVKEFIRGYSMEMLWECRTEIQKTLKPTRWMVDIVGKFTKFSYDEK